MQTVRSIHDCLTLWGQWLAMALLAAIAFSFSYEVAARYVFNAPTSWANAFVSYFLCAAIFLIVPEITRRNSHIVITLIRDMMPSRALRAHETAVRIVGAVMCLFAAWFCGMETWQQYLDGIDTISALPVPKWMVTIFIPYGLVSSGLYFLRHAFEPAPEAPETFGA